MNKFNGLKNYQLVILCTIILFLTIFTLWIRVLPLLTLNTDILNIVASDDPMYNLRQVEQMLANYPAYSWFEAMSLYPFGQDVPWGPLFTWITTTFVMIAGAANRNEITSVALWIPPLMAAIMVPVMFILVRKISDWKAGLFAAFLIAVVGGQYFFRALAGYLDHHIAEVLFSTLFCIAYIYALVYFREHTVDFKNKETWMSAILLSSLAGISYFLGFLTMSTMILFAFIVALSTIFISVVDFYHGKAGEYLVLLNTFSFGLAAVLSFAVSIISSGFDEGFGFYLYTLVHPVSYMLLVVGTWVLYLLARYLKGKSRILYPISIIGLGFIAFLGLFLFVPGMYGSFINGIEVFFGFNPFAKTVQEARPWSIEEAWGVFNFGLILMAAGALVLLYRSWKEYRPEHIFVLVWSMFIIVAAFRQVRYEYYLAVNIALLGGICLGFFLNRAWPDICAMGRRVTAREPKKEPDGEPLKEEPKATLKAEKGKGKKAGKKPEQAQKGAEKPEQASKKAVPKSRIRYVHILVAAFFCACALLFAVGSVQYEYAVASSGGIRMNPDWRESLEWMETDTPDPGVEYLRIYDKDTFEYPAESYGVMSWWDYGHLITYIAKRIPNANPFQAGVYGPDGAAAYFMSQSEDESNRIADAKGTRYVVTDIEMSSGKFWAMATWYNSSAGQSPYVKTVLAPEEGPQGAYSAVSLYDASYFNTMIARLHNFDGSMITGGQAYYVEVDDRLSSYPVAKVAQLMETAVARAAADAYNQKAAPGTRAMVLSSNLLTPIDMVPALRHYRLVHESPTNVVPPGAGWDIRYVKVFEYVPGARIQGNGIIALDLVGNTGRKFTYRQASIDGEFIVPYSTTGNPYDVKAVGRYRIEGTGREIDVPEEAVMRGLQVG
ncbi:MAG TPA: oligosaccharyl transferase, archaeosortase A system-associated [Methanolinea sp.]|nr:oligosaccharyl transferase, archaeosortase A system-associated [Methanolinea sp.]